MASAAKRRLVPTYQESNKEDFDDEDNYYGNKKQMQRNKNKYDNEDDDYIKPKKFFNLEELIK